MTAEREETRAARLERENAEREVKAGDPALTRNEKERAADHQRLSALTVFAIIRREGDIELRRPLRSLWWSGIAAGIGISTSVLAQGILLQALGDHPLAWPIASLGYAFGFVLVILSRLQLFTENTLSVVLPTLSDPTAERFARSARLWAVVLAANLIGTFATAFISTKLGTVGADTMAGILNVSRHAAEVSGWRALVLGIPAGFYVAALVWMLPSSKGFEIFVIILFAWLIAAGGFAHVIAGSAEMFILMVNGEMTIAQVFGAHLLPVLVGNIIGGTGLFALLAYGQIHAEI
jgi:formate/nitrite transporter FocA (FNT family)